MEPVPQRRPFDVLADWATVAIIVALVVLFIQWVAGLVHKDDDCSRTACPEGQVSALVNRECRCVTEGVE